MAVTPQVPGAELQISALLDDLTTAGTVWSGHTVVDDAAGLHPAGARNPSGVPGLQIDGYFPDSSTYNTHHGWDHDSQFVIRLPERWTGGLVVSGTPGVRRQYANDFTICDWVLSRGYAYAATDKGNSGPLFFYDGVEPGDAIVEWQRRLIELTQAAAAVVEQRYGSPAERTLAAGVSNGGYLVRWALENHPELFDGGLDWEGTLWRPEGPNLLTFLPAVVRHYPAYAESGDQRAHDAIIAAGFAPGSEPLWEYHNTVYWPLTQWIFRAGLDPSFEGETDADYDYVSRPASVREAVRRISLTGRITRPLITLHGTLDSLLPISQCSDVYADMVSQHGREHLHRYFRIEGGNHVDGLYDAHPNLVRPILPCFLSAFDALETWVDTGQEPPPSATLTRPTSGDLATVGGLENQNRRGDA